MDEWTVARPHESNISKVTLLLTEIRIGYAKNENLNFLIETIFLIALRIRRERRSEVRKPLIQVFSLP